MLKFLGIILLIGIIFAIVKYFLVFLVAVTVNGIKIGVAIMLGAFKMVAMIGNATTGVVSGSIFR